VPDVEIPLTRGLVAVVDPEDAERVLAFGKWHVAVGGRGRTVYARTWLRPNGRRQVGVLLHTFLTGWPRTDHIDGDGLNNRRSNLRPATNAQNMRNAPLRRDSVSGYKGVAWDKYRWRAHIRVDGRRLHLGMFADPAEAARAYDAAAREHFGEFARLNFPEEDR
jgi:hypothetical protein